MVGAPPRIGILLRCAVGDVRRALQVHFIIASCENMIAGKSMRPGDVLTAANGKTVEVRG